MGQFAVIGLGRFGAAASTELVKLGHSVLGVDLNSKTANKYADTLTHVVIADVTDRHALEELDLGSYDMVLVAIGAELQACLLCVVHLKSLGVKNIWVKAISHAQHLILGKLGVTRIIHPEQEMGVRVAQLLSYPMVTDYISLGNGEFIVEIDISEEMDNISVNTLLEGVEQEIHVLLVKSKATVTVSPDNGFVLNTNDIIVLLGQLAALRAVARRLA